MVSKETVNQCPREPFKAYKSDLTELIVFECVFALNRSLRSLIGIMVKLSLLKSVLS